MKRKKKLLYTDKDTDFEPGETVTGRVADFVEDDEEDEFAN